MPDYPSISKTQPTFPDYLDFQFLRRIGIDHVQKLSSKLWTDYNLHDPGLTILEVLCYAITDLGYRINLDIEDLLALNPKDARSQENNFFTPDELLTCNPVTEMDLRKRLIDIPGVRNAWVERVGVGASTPITPAINIDSVNGHLQFQSDHSESERTLPTLNLKGLYRVYLDFESNIVQQAEKKMIQTEVKKALCSYRNLCEDYDYNIEEVGKEGIGLCAEIELETSADPEDILVEIYVQMQAFLSPCLRFYTLSELLDRGKSPAEIFAGRPSAIRRENSKSSLYDTTGYESNGFIDANELDALRPLQTIHTSDLYKIIMGVSGVVAIKRLSITNYIDDEPKSIDEPWSLDLTDKHRPVLNLDKSRVTFYKGNLPFNAIAVEVKRRYYEQQAANIKSPRDQNELDMPVPQGTYYDLADHYSIHHDFPQTYGISEDGLAGTETLLRQGQANQLKGYLIFFDQILANYFAQLAHVRDLFSWNCEETREQQIDDIWRQNRSRTYFTQALTNLPGVKEIVLNFQRDSGNNSFGEMPNDYISVLDRISEDSIGYQDRRNRFLDHLLARFAETFSDYVQLNYQLKDGSRRKEIDIIKDKVQFLREYPELSRDRFRAFNYCKCGEIWDTNNVSGFQKRVSRLLGTDRDKCWRRSLNHYKVITGGFRFSIGIDPEKPLLQSKPIYTTIEDAQAALDEFLVFVLNPTHYKRLIYNSYSRFSYSWEIIDENSNSLAIYNQQFSNQSERNNILKPLFKQDLELFLSANDGSAVVSEILQDSPGSFAFKIIIFLGDQTTYEFISVKEYESEELAKIAAQTAQQHMQNSSAYRAVRISRPNGNSEKLYGYGVMDNDGNIGVENTERFADISLRDLNLQTWLSLLQPTENNDIGSFLRIESILGPKKRKVTKYHFKLLNRQGDILLVGSKPQLNESAARRHFHRDVLSILFESGAIEHTSSNSDSNFSFRIINPQMPIQNLATHPYNYPSAAQRDIAINQLKVLVSATRLQTTISPRQPINIGRICDVQGMPLLYQDYSNQPKSNDQKEVFQAGNNILELAQDQDNFRLINDQDGNSVYSWELTNQSKDKILAVPPQTFSSRTERDQSISDVQALINDEGFHMVEHILLRPRQPGDNFLPIAKDSPTTYRSGNVAAYDPYSFWVSVILPYWPTRFRDLNFRQLVEQTLRLEAPAHVCLKICWIDACQMEEFEAAYKNWLEQLSLDACPGAASDLTGSLNRLLAILTDLKNIYPEGTLHDCNEGDQNDNPIILNQTVLGTSNSTS